MLVRFHKYLINIMINNNQKGCVIMFKEFSDLISIEELCEALSIGRNMAYKLLNSGEIKAFKCGRIWKIPKEGVEIYIRLRSGL